MFSHRCRLLTVANAPSAPKIKPKEAPRPCADPLLLPAEEGLAELAEHFASGCLEEIEVAGVVNVVAERAVRIVNAMAMNEGLVAHGRFVAFR